MKRSIAFGVLIVLVFSLVACAAGPNPMKAVKTEESEVAGFWSGVWHGFIAPIAFIVSLFNDKVNIYEVNNNGGWYNFGFILGAMVIFGGSGGGAGRGRSRRRG